jgi:hypothetical protein
MRIKIAAAGIATLVALGVFAAITLGGDSSGRGSFDPGRTFEKAPVQRAASPGAGASASAVARASRSGPKVSYFETTVPESVAAGEIHAVFTKCPRRNKALSGYFFNNGPGVFLDYSAVGAKSARRWDFEAANLNSAGSVNVFFGIVCGKRL